MKPFFSLFILFLATFSLSAQECPGGGTVPSGTSTASFGSSSSTGSFSAASGISMPNINYLSNVASNGNYNAAKLAYNRIDGSPYLSKEPVNAQIVANNGAIIEDVSLNIDVYAKEVIATNEKGEEIVLDTRYYKEISFMLDGQELVFKKLNPKSPNQFYQVLYEDGEMVFYKTKDAKLQEGMDRGIVKTNPKFNQRTNYFIKQGENDIAQIKLKKKDVFNLFPETEIIAMQDYAKRKGIKLKKEADFVAMFAGANDDD